MHTQPLSDVRGDIPVPAPRTWQVAIADLAQPGTLCVVLGEGIARITSSSRAEVERTFVKAGPAPLRLPADRLGRAGYVSSGCSVAASPSSPTGLPSTEQRGGSARPWRAPTRPVTITAGTSLSHS